VISRLVGALVVILTTIFAMPATAGASAPPGFNSAHAFTYDNNHHATATTYAATERGPPATYDHTTPYDADGLPRRGALACSSDPTPDAIYVYEDNSRRARVDNVIGTISEPPRLNAGVLSSIQRWHVAAKSGDDLVDVWRVVGPDEAAGITKTGGYSVQLGGEGKYFFPTRGQAENLGQMYNKANWPGPQTLTRGQVPRSVISRAEPVNAGTEGPGWFIRSPDIPRICNVLCMGTIQ
jgi:hypothetical protein